MLRVRSGQKQAYKVNKQREMSKNSLLWTVFTLKPLLAHVFETVSGSLGQYVGLLATEYTFPSPTKASKAHRSRNPK